MAAITSAGPKRENRSNAEQALSKEDGECQKKCGSHSKPVCSRFSGCSGMTMTMRMTILCNVRDPLNRLVS